MSTPLGNTIIVGNINFKIKAYSEEEIETINFYIDGELQFSDNEPPFEWKMNKRFGERFISRHTLKAVALFNGGCKWTEEIGIWYFHLRKNN
jgi:hypothetical protein